MELDLPTTSSHRPSRVQKNAAVQYTHPKNIFARIKKLANKKCKPTLKKYICKYKKLAKFGETLF
jgi:hypothetical protein